MWVSKRKYEELEAKYNTLKEKYDVAVDESPENFARRTRETLKEYGLNPNTDKYLQIVERIALEQLGHQSPMLKRYSETAFIKDTDDETMKRAIEYVQEQSLITKRGKGK